MVLVNNFKGICIFWKYFIHKNQFSGYARCIIIEVSSMYSYISTFISFNMHI